LNRHRRSCSTELQSAFASLIKQRHLIISVPQEDQKMHVHHLPTIYNQPCNQRTFYENLKHETFTDKKRHNPTFLIKPSYQSPEDRCFSFFQRNRDLQGPSVLSQQNENPLAIMHFSLDYANPNQIKNIPNEDHSQNTHLIFPRDADTILFIFYITSSFYERYTSIQYFLSTINEVPDSRLRAEPCSVMLSHIPKVASVQYRTVTSTLNANTIPLCDPKFTTSIHKTTFNTFHVQFPGGKLIPIAPQNANSDRLYYKRESTLGPTNPLPWFNLKIITGPPRLKPQNLVRILPFADTHLLDHKFLFAPPALRPRHTTITYKNNFDFFYNSNFTSPPISNSYPAQLTYNNQTNHQTSYLQHSRCSFTDLRKNLYPFGPHEIELLNVLAPLNPREFCQHLPNPDLPTNSYQQLEEKISNLTRTNHTWFSWSAELDNSTNSTENTSFSNSLSIQEILNLYKNFTPANNEYRIKLHHAQINNQFATFDLHFYTQEMLHKINQRSDIQKTQANKQIASNEIFTTQQLIKLYAKKLWKIHFIRQNLLQKALLIWKTRRFLKTISNFGGFKKDVIYEHKLVNDKIYSWNRLLILGDRDYEHRFTIPEIETHQDEYWNPTKLAALFGGAIAAGTALAYGAYNILFAGSKIRSDQSFYAQLSLHAINNQTLPSP